MVSACPSRNKPSRMGLKSPLPAGISISSIERNKLLGDKASVETVDATSAEAVQQLYARVGNFDHLAVTTHDAGEPLSGGDAAVGRHRPRSCGQVLSVPLLGKVPVHEICDSVPVRKRLHRAYFGSRGGGVMSRITACWRATMPRLNRLRERWL